MSKIAIIAVILLLALLLLSCKEDERDTLALKNMKKRVLATIDSADLIMKEKASMDSLELIKDSLRLVCDSSCEARKVKFKNSTIGIILHQSGAAQGGSWYVNKTTTGGYAMYRSPKHIFQKTLSMEEWQDLINALSECFVNWEKDEDYGGPPWVIKILSLNKNKKIDTLRFDMPRGKPSVNNWEKVMEAIFDVFEEK